MFEERSVTKVSFISAIDAVIYMIFKFRQGNALKYQLAFKLVVITSHPCDKQVNSHFLTWAFILKD